MKYRIRAYSIHELGQRNNQEDSLFPPFSEEPSNGDLFILCDGMGGHAAGEVASMAVCDTMSKCIEGIPRKDDQFDEEEFNAALNAAYDTLDTLDTGDEKKMGTTLTFAKFHEGGCFIAHIGDSRIYHIRPSEKRILHVTRDHSLVNNLIDLGEMTPGEAKHSRQKNVITRAMQPHQESRSKADCFNLTDIQTGDYLYLCSDGMLEEMEDRELVNILSLSLPDSKKVEILKGATKDNKDNHSAIMIHLVPLGDDLQETSVYEAGDDAGNKKVVNKRRIIKTFIISALVTLIVLIAAFFFFGGQRLLTR